MTWSFELNWTPGGDDPDALTVPSLLPWWMDDPSGPPTEGADPGPSEDVTMSDDNMDMSLRHPYTLLPLHFFAPPSQTGGGATGWRCTSCGKLNVQRNLCIQRCGSCSVSSSRDFPVSPAYHAMLWTADGCIVYDRRPMVWPPSPSRMFVSSAERIPSPSPGTSTERMSRPRHRRGPTGCADSPTKSLMGSSYIISSLVTTPRYRLNLPSSFMTCRQRLS